jgi:AcrR family transcriptional regulator
MSNLTKQSDRRPLRRSPDRRLLAAARRLFVQRGPDVTLSEILFAHLERPGHSLQDVARMLAVSPRALPNK